MAPLGAAATYRGAHRRQEERVLYRKGADPEALDRAARELTACAGEVEVIRANGTRALAVLGRSWGGADADAAQESWRSTSSRADRRSARPSTGWPHGSADNARAQRSASGGRREPAHAGAARSRSGSAGQASVGAEATAEPPFADGLRGTRPQEIDLELAELAKGVYDGTGTDSFDAARRLAARGARDRSQDAHGSGRLRREHLSRREGDYVLAFAGTDPTSVNDWGDQRSSRASAASARQHLQAIALAQHLAGAVGSENMVLHRALTRRRSREHGLRRHGRPGRDVQRGGRPPATPCSPPPPSVTTTQDCRRARSATTTCVARS